MSAPTVPLPLQPRASDRPPREERWGAGASLSLVAHLALVAGLAWSVNWHTDSGEAVEAELWATVPQVAAPAPTVTEPVQSAAQEATPVPPPPPPPVAEPPAQRAPDIVTERDTKLQEREKQRQAEDAERQKQKKLDDAKREKAEQQKLQAKQDDRKKADDQKAAAKMRADQMARIAAMAGDGSGTSDKPSSGRASRTAGPSAGYYARIKAKIKPNILPTREFPPNLTTEVLVNLAPDGRIVSYRVVQGSGDAAWDQEALKAVERTGNLGRDDDGSVPREGFVLIINPRGE